MTRENLIEFGANLVALQRLTRWTCDPKDQKMQDYVFEDNISLMWDIFRDQLVNLGGKSFAKDRYSINYFEEAVWEIVNQFQPNIVKLLDEAIDEFNSGQSYNWNGLGGKAKDFYRGYIEIIVDAAIKLGEVQEKNQGYFEK